MITSNTNKQVKKVASYLKQAKARREDGVYVVEGIRIVEEIPEEDFVHLYVSDSYARKNKQVTLKSGKKIHFLNEKTLDDSTSKKLENAASSMVASNQKTNSTATSNQKTNSTDISYGSAENDIFDIVADDIFKKMTDTQTPQGILAVVKQKKYSLTNILKENKKQLLLILEDIQDPGNLGTMFRSGEGAGVTCVILSRNSADVYNPKVVRSTMGAIFRVPFVYVDDLPDIVSKLEKKGIHSYAAHLKGTKNYDEMDYTASSAFLIGNEGNGLSKEAADAAQDYILIPMLGQVESMNAATSAAILTFEAARQRRQQEI